MSTLAVNTITDASGGSTAKINGATPTLDNTMGRNRIINGGMAIAQRATSATITAGGTIAAGYATVDRWYCYSTGGNVTMARVAGSGTTQYRLQITGGASVSAVGVGQRIEQLNCYDLANTTATLSVDLANSVLTTVTWTAYYATTTADTFGTLASPTRTQIATGTFTVNSTVTNYSTNISIPSAATTGIEIVFTVGAQTSGTWTIGNVQLEAGSVATPFERRSYGTELALCQRYCFVTTSTPTYAGYGNGTTDIRCAVTVPVSMRASPSVSLTSGTSYGWTTAGAKTSTSTSVTLIFNGGNLMVINLPGFTGISDGYVASLYLAGILTLSAEL